MVWMSSSVMPASRSCTRSNTFRSRTGRICWPSISLDGAFLTTRAGLRQRGQHHLHGLGAFVGSLAVEAAYVTAKHGLIGLCKTVVQEGGKRGIRTNVIWPGYVRTPPKCRSAQATTMEHRSPCCIDDGQSANKPPPRHLGAALAVALLVAALGGCNERSPTPVSHAKFVRTEIVRPQDRQISVTLTGEVQARYRADLSFRVSGRVIERFVDVGSHVDPGQVLARIDPAEQQADVDAATAAVIAAESQLRVANATFARQKTLIAEGFTTRVAFDQAQEGLRNAEGSLEAAKAQLGRAKDALGETELRARAAGVITARSIEVGQVVEAAHRVFTLAQDGERDAVFDVDESIFFGDFDSGPVSLTLVSDPNVTAIGNVREVSPVLDPKSSTVRVKVAIQNPPAGMTLGSAVAGTAKRKPISQIRLPWTALMAIGSKPAVWIVDPATNTAALKPVSVSDYEAGGVWISAGLEPGARVVADGGKLLSPGERVAYEEGR